MKNAHWILVIILLGGFLVRLYRFTNPIADWHSWRQADTSAVSRNFIISGFDLLHPRYDDISNVQTGKDNPEGYRFVEFPLYNLFQAGLFKTIDVLTLEEWGRIVTIFSSLLTTLFLYLIVSKHANKKIGLLSAFFYTYTPYNIYYGRTILPDPSMAMAIFGGIWFFDIFLEKRRYAYFLLSIIFTASALLLKPYAIFFTLPMIYLAWKEFGFGFLKKWELWIFFVFSILPLVLWRLWMMKYPEGIPANTWLLNGNGIRFHPAFFRWLFYERITKLISGYGGIILLGWGLYLVKKTKNSLFFFSFLFSSLLYLVVFATGNVQHDYYQILITPSLAIFYGIGAYYLLIQHQRFVGLTVCLIATSIFFIFGWYQIRDYFNINNPSLVIAGQAVNRLTPKHAKIIAPYNGDTSFLYQTKRKGWPSQEKSLPDMIAMGADYMVIANPGKADLELGKTYNIVSETKEYVLFDLRKKP